MSWLKRSYTKVLIVFLLLAISFGVSLHYNKKVYSGEVKIGGDIYSGGSVQDITINSDSVISASGNVNVSSADGTNSYPISNYNLDAQRQVVDSTWASSVIAKLEKVPHKDINELSVNNMNALNLPEGTIWIKRSGDYIINGATFSGKGTIIVKDGDLKIDGDIKYNTSDPNTSVGFIVTSPRSNKGNIIIKDTVMELRGAYYTTGTIEIK